MAARAPWTLLALLLASCSTWPRATAEHQYCAIQSFGWRLLSSPPSNEVELISLIKERKSTRDNYWFGKKNGNLLLCEMARTPVVDEEYRLRGCMSRSTTFSKTGSTWFISDATAIACGD